MALPGTQFKLSPGWRIAQNGRMLEIYGGADAIYEIELSTDKRSFFIGLPEEKSFEKADLDENDLAAFEQLLTAEILMPVLPNEPKLQVEVLGDEIALQIKQKTAKKANFTVLIRVNSTFAELLEKTDYHSLKKPHLFVDLAYNRTISIGPLVVPGDTTCVACLRGRLMTRWGDEKPPEKPTVAHAGHTIANELIQMEIDKIAKGDTSLANKTVSWNFLARTVRQDQLLKVPLCPTCGENELDGNGAVVLPWD